MLRKKLKVFQKVTIKVNNNETRPRTKRSDADEDRDLSNYHGQSWNNGLFPDSRET